MKRYMERLWELMTDEESMHHIPLYDEDTPEGVSYAQLRILSGQIYAYLKDHGIGREDFVLLKLPRGVKPYIAMLGVWRAGAACVIAEEEMAPERVEFIQRDCGCKLALTRENWQDIMAYAPLDGYEDTALHDASYAVYTSGTTGNPKGILHEYGNLERRVLSYRYQGGDMAFAGARWALPMPLNFESATMAVTVSLYKGDRSIWVISYPTLKDPKALINFLLEKKISVLGMSFTFARKLVGHFGPHLQNIIVGGESVSNFTLDGVKNVYNLYAQSEAGIYTSVFRIDREYDVCPVGRPQFDLKYRIIDEDGNDVQDGEIGEFIFENPYVRGYINLPEETAKAFRNGFFHTGDLMQLLPDGNLVIRGRKNDMIKINGNRIEPAEIESAIRSILNIDWCAVRGFAGADHSFICAYYKEDISFDADELRAKLQRRLPHYMIPAKFMKIDAIPVNRNGKMDRNALPKPEFGEIRWNYKAPTNETEATLCRAMQAVLGLERVGIHDDFYEMGGDSLRSMELLLKSALPGLDMNQIFRGRTPCRIAGLYLAQCSGRDTAADIQLNEKARAETYALTTEQLYMFEYQKRTPDSTMYNIFTLLRVDKAGLDLDRFARAAERAIENHSALKTRLTLRDDGTLVQKYDPDMLVSVKPEKVSLAEFEIIKDTLVQPFRLVDSPLHRCRLFETGEAAYLFLDVHHILFDGTSLKLLINNMINAYLGVPPEPDYYCLTLQKRLQAEQTELYREAREYFEQTYGGTDWTRYPAADHEQCENRLGSLRCRSETSAARISLAEKKLMVSRNEFFIGAALLAQAISTGKQAVQVSWIYNGRDDLAAASSAGLFYRDLPVALQLRDDSSLRDIFAEIREQVKNGIRCSCYPYIEHTPNIEDGDITCVLYQGDIHALDIAGKLNLHTVELRQNKAAAQNILDIHIFDDSDALQYLFDYAAGRYEAQTMSAFQRLFDGVVSAIATESSFDTLTFGKLRSSLGGRAD